MSNQKDYENKSNDCTSKSSENGATESGYIEKTSNNVKNQKRISTGLQDDGERRDGPGGN